MPIITDFVLDPTCQMYDLSTQCFLIWKSNDLYMLLFLWTKVNEMLTKVAISFIVIVDVSLLTIWLYSLWKC